MLAFERIGSGPPLVLLHGVGHRRQAWYPVLEHLTDRREVILVDLPGHGESDPLVLDGRTGVRILRDELTTFFEQQGLHRPHIAGNSLGGRMALEAAVLGIARSVTAFSPAGFWRTDAGFGYTRRLFGTVERVGRRVGDRAPRLVRTTAGRAMMFGWINAHPSRLDPELALGDFHAFTRAQPALHTLVREATPFTGTVPADIPVTIGWGAWDLVLPPYQARRARTALPAARHVRLPGCGHVPMSDDPELVAGVLLRGSGG
ncbi:MAG TPA: alpha/beta fold hydrolase [Pseudonocardiaceae bacterium]